MKQLRVFEFCPTHVSLMRALSWEGEDDFWFNRRRYFLIRRFGKRGKVYFSLESTNLRPKDYVRCVTRVTPLADYEVKALLVSCFLYESERALSIGSSWSLKTQPKRVLDVIKNLFPDWKFFYDDYLSDLRLQIDLKEDRRLQLVRDRIAYDRCVKRSVFPRLAIAPKTIS